MDSIGKIISIDNETVVVKLGVDLNVVKDVVDRYIYFNKNDIKIVGHVTKINLDSIFISLKGEIKDNQFIVGLLAKPSFGDDCFLFTNEEVLNKIIKTSNNEN